MLLNDGQVVPLAPQALGETTPIMATGYFYAKDGLFLEKRFAYYAEIYKGQPWVAAAVNKRANAVARLSLNVWDNAPDLGKNLDTGSPYARLLRMPCPFLSPFAFWRWVVSTYDIYGEMFVYKLRNPDTGEVTALLPMHPSRTFIRRAARDDEWPGARAGDCQYVFTLGTATYGYVTADTTDVVAWLRYNPDTEMRGWSLLEPLRSTLMNEDSARRAMAAMFRNMGRPSLALMLDKAVKPEVGKRIKAEFDAIHSGSDNAGSTLVLPTGMSAMPFQLNAEELAYIESRKINREEVAGVFDMPPPVLQITDNATFCLPAGALVSTSRGPVPISDIAAGDRVWSLTDEGFQLQRVVTRLQTGTKPLLTVRTQNRELRCTDNHPVLVRRTSRVRRVGSRGAAYRHEHVWVPAGELVVGDIIVTAGELPDVGGDWSPTRVVSEGFAEFCGLLLGDGCLAKANGRPSGVRIARGSSAQYMDRYREVMRAEFRARDGEIRLDEQERETRFSSVSAARELVELGFDGNARTKRVPGWVFGLSEKLRLAFLRGFLDSDGSCDKKGRLSFSSVNGPMLAQIRMLCIGLGIPVTNLHRQDGYTTLPNGRQHPIAQWTFTCSDPGQNRRVGSHDPRYQERLASGVAFGAGRNSTYYAYRAHGRSTIEPPAGCGHAKVTRIDRSVVAVPVFDIEVEGSHNFVAEGVVVHNSNITEQMRSFYRDTMAPLIEDLESVLDSDLKPEFPGNKFARFAVDEVLRGNVEDRASTAVAMVTNGIAKPAEVRPWFDLNDAGPVANVLYANAGLQPLGSVKESVTVSGPGARLVPETFEAGQDPPPPTPPQPAVPPPTSTPADGAVPAVMPPKPGKFFRPIMGRLGRGKSFEAVRDELLRTVADADRDELVRDLVLAAGKRKP